MSRFSIILSLSLGLSVFSVLGQKPKVAPPKPPVYLDDAGKLAYTPESKGDRIPDFSFCGYKASEEVIPFIAGKVKVEAANGDATTRIQAAIDYVAGLPVDAKGFRGAVVLGKGVFEIKGNLRIQTSGIVIRGAGRGQTILKGIGISRETLISIRGKDDKKIESSEKVLDTYVPVGQACLSVNTPEKYKVGERILIQRPSTKEWIQTLKTDHFGGGVTALGWKPNQRDITWERTITQITAKGICLDIPLTTALDSTYGAGTVTKFQWNGRINQIGIENLSLESSYDTKNPKDENHRWMAIGLENVSDAWVRQVDFKHFAGSAVHVQASARCVTVEDCIATQPISEIAGQRRYTFFTSGQQTLFQRIYAEEGYHDFAVGYCAAGPNAFVQCESKLPYSFSGTIDSWASGVLFDIVNVDGNALRFSNLGQDGQGAGWSAANSVFWQCAASRVECQKPPTAQNWAFGTWAQFDGDGYWDMSNEHIKPRSLFYAQLQNRLGGEVQARTFLMPTETEASSSPKVEVAMALTKASVEPAKTLKEFIEKASQRLFLNTTEKLQSIEQIGIPKIITPNKAPDLQVQNGWLVRGKSLQTGKRQEVPWWSGVSRPHGLATSKPHITRFVPGQTGKGLTDDLVELSDWMQQNHVKVMDHNYGLWYERRRDDHERIRRMDGEVWPPFYELPFARSGKETAWDGLSKYDLTQYNQWYWSRLKQFADLADQKSLVLFHQNYFQHNIIEAGAHYADFPWRPANNINQTGFPEPVPYAGDKRIFMAEQFYDINHPVRRKLHRAYIRQCLDNFTGNTGVVQLISAEYTGPLHFVEFWLDVIDEWQKEKHKDVLVALSTTKDVQDAILADKKRSAVVDIIDIRYWHYQLNGQTYEPKGGQNLAPRQHARLLNPKRSSSEQVYRAVNEYRMKYPTKAVVYNGDSFDANGWAAFMAGGSIPSLSFDLPQEISTQLIGMQPIQWASQATTQWVLGQLGQGYFIYSESSTEITADLSKEKGTFEVKFLSPKDGNFLSNTEILESGKSYQLKNPTNGSIAIWIKKK